MKNERKFLFKRKMRLLFISSIILLGLSLILWFYASDNTVETPLEEIKQDTNLSSKIPLKNTLPDKEIPDKESNSENSNSIHSSQITEITPPVITNRPSDSQFKGSPFTTTNPKKINKTFNLILRNETRSPDGFSRYVYTINN